MLPTAFILKFCPILPTFNPTALFVTLFLWLNGWSWYICFILFNDIMDLHISSLSDLVRAGPCRVFCAIRRQVYWGLTYKVVLLLVPWLGTSNITTHTHISKDTQHRQGSRDWLTHINIMLTPPFTCSQQLFELHWIIIHWYQKFTLQNSAMSLLFSNFLIVEVTDLLIRSNKTNFFSCKHKE